MSNNTQYKLKIAQVIDVYENATNGAGISTQRFTKLLREDGHKVIVLSTGNEQDDKVVLKEFYAPVSYLKKIMQNMKFVFAMPERAILRKTFEQVDIIHNQFPLILGMAAISLAKEMNKPVISTFHVQGEQMTYNAGLNHPFWTKLIYKFFVHFIYNKSDLVICPSKFAALELKKYGLKNETVVISNGVTNNFKPVYFSKKYPDRFTILTVGRNAVEKRQELLIKAIAASKYKKNIQLIILGDGPLRNKLNELSKELLNGNVEFKFLPPEKLIEYYNTADLYVHTADIEVECMTAMEAMACGLPLLIADCELSATKQFALNEKHLFKTQEELTEKINYWFEHQDELEETKADYLELAKEYAIENSYKKLLAAYQKVLKINSHKEPIASQVFELATN